MGDFAAHRQKDASMDVLDGVNWTANLTSPVAAITGAVVGLLGLFRTAAELSKKGRLRRSLEKNLQLLAACTPLESRTRLIRLIEIQLGRYVYLESTPIYRRRGVRLTAVLTLVGLAAAALITTWGRPSTDSVVIRYASLTILGGVVLHVVLLVLTSILSNIRTFPDVFVHWLDGVAEDGLLRIFAWNLGYIAPPEREAEWEPKREPPADHTEAERAKEEQAARMEEIIAYLRSNA